MPPSSSSAPSHQAAACAVVAPAAAASGRDADAVCRAEYHEEVFGFWRDLGIALLFVIGGAALAVVVLCPLLIGLRP